MWNSSSAFCSGNNWEFLGTGEVAELTRVTEQLTSMLNVMQRWDAVKIHNVGQNRELFTVNFVTRSGEVEKWRSGEVKVVEARGTWHGTHGVSNEFNERKRQRWVTRFERKHVVRVVHVVKHVEARPKTPARQLSATSSELVAERRRREASGLPSDVLHMWFTDIPDVLHMWSCLWREYVKKNTKMII